MYHSATIHSKKRFAEISASGIAMDSMVTYHGYSRRCIFGGSVL